MGENAEGLSRNMYEGHMDKAKGGQDQGQEVGMAGVGVSGGGEMETTVLEQQEKKEKKLGINKFYKWGKQPNKP